jgi:hypothetical protein
LNCADPWLAKNARPSVSDAAIIRRCIVSPLENMFHQPVTSIKCFHSDTAKSSVAQVVTTHRTGAHAKIKKFRVLNTTVKAKTVYATSKFNLAVTDCYSDIVNKDKLVEVGTINAKW